MAQHFQAPLVDDFGRHYRKLRISVTDRCQFRCLYCMPDGPSGGTWLPKQALLSYEEIAAFVTLAADTFGIDEVRLTGGEPLLRRDLAKLIGLLRAIPSVRRLALTTNGILLAEYLPQLVAAGLDAITVSIDSLDQTRFKYLSGGGDLATVLRGINALAKTQLEKKLNAVVIRSQNDDELTKLLQWAQNLNMELRFIEYMPFGSPWGWDAVVTQKQMLEIISTSLGPIQPIAVAAGSTSRRFSLPRLGGYTFGIIPTMDETLCSECDRLRLTADGRVLNCLFDQQGITIKDDLRRGNLATVVSSIHQHFAHKGPGYLARLPWQQPKQFVPLDHMHRVGG